jgi:hypothetical protein
MSIMLYCLMKALLITIIFSLTSLVDPHHFTNEWLTALLPLHLISKDGITQLIRVCLASCQDMYSKTTTYNAKSKSGKFKNSYNPAPMALRSMYTCMPGSTAAIGVLLVNFLSVRDSFNITVKGASSGLELQYDSYCSVSYKSFDHGIQCTHQQI